MSVDLVQYFKDRLAPVRQAATEAHNRRARLLREAQVLADEVEASNDAIRKKEQVIADARAAGLDTASLDAQREDAQRRSLDMTERLKTLDAAAKATGNSEEEANLTALVDACEALGELGVRAAVLVSDPTVWSCLLRWESAGDPTSRVKTDRFGHPLTCSVSVAGGKVISVPVKPTDRHFVRGYWPPELEWLRFEERVDPKAGREVEAPAEVHALIDDSSMEVILLRDPSEFGWSRGRSLSGPPSDRQLRRIACITRRLPDELEAAVKAMGELDLDGDYGVGSPLEFIRRLVVEQTESKPQFAASTRRLTSMDTHAVIRADWQRFVDAPWSGAVAGPLAKLKYLVENGERPRFWCEEHENHYGFRVRTRDHTWLKGSLFIRASEGVGEGMPEIEVESEKGESPAMAVIGRMRLRVVETK